ncbi:MAG: phosphotransferase [Bdellovibrionales bacterium CG10_big_fil_rev_8_21_14_0_10_45_34]|nr:MAG: phosphotransferase [Bdellovibrionales bacterium CG10_big_fil_rev_8_21_14_0_10_45_34]
MVLGDFHIHSTYSDGQLSIAQLVDLYGNLGFKAIAITDHLCETNSFLGRSAHYLSRTLTEDSFNSYIEEIDSEGERALKKFNMLVLPGFEVTKNSISNHRSAHIVALGARKFISANQSVDEILMEIREQGAISIAAHPVWTRKIEKQTFHLWDKLEHYKNLFDAWEVASGKHLFHEVQHARLPMIASSDLHHPRQIASWKTVMDKAETKEQVLENIKGQKLDFRFFQNSVGYPFRHTGCVPQFSPAKS